MSTYIAPCGCYITYSMFGKREIMSLCPCLHHMLDRKLQYMLDDVANKLTDITKSDPGHFDENWNWVSEKVDE